MRLEGVTPAPEKSSEVSTVHPSKPHTPSHLKKQVRVTFVFEVALPASFWPHCQNARAYYPISQKHGDQLIH